MELSTFGQELTTRLTGSTHLIWPDNHVNQKQPTAHVRVESIKVTQYPTLGKAIARIVFTALGNSHLCNNDQPYVFLDIEASNGNIKIKNEKKDKVSKISLLKALALKLAEEVLEELVDPIFEGVDLKKIINSIRIPGRKGIDLEVHASLVFSEPDKIRFFIVEVKHITKVNQYHHSREYLIDIYKQGGDLYMLVLGNWDEKDNNIKRIGGIIQTKLEEAEKIITTRGEIELVTDLGVGCIYKLGTIY